MHSGTIFKIQKFSIHDGPGIRTAVFMKGCPLSCWWCHNPESQEQGAELSYNADKCLSCSKCVNSCEKTALSIGKGRLTVDKSRCSDCRKCTDGCPGGALEVIGLRLSASQVVEAAAKDVIFYDESGGGVTFTGGEPMMQPEFLLEMLKICKDEGINTAVDTSGFAPWDRFEAIHGLVDYFLYDLKHIDEEKHMKFTGVSNKLILSNLEKLSGMHSDINIRIPVIPGINDDQCTISDFIDFLRTLDLKRVNLLPYHTTGEYKYQRLGVRYRLTGTPSPEIQKMQEIKELFEKSGFTTKIGG